KGEMIHPYICISCVEEHSPAFFVQSPFIFIFRKVKLCKASLPWFYPGDMGITVIGNTIGQHTDYFTYGIADTLKFLQGKAVNKIEVDGSIAQLPCQPGNFFYLFDTLLPVNDLLYRRIKILYAETHSSEPRFVQNLQVLVRCISR